MTVVSSANNRSLTDESLEVQLSRERGTERPQVLIVQVLDGISQPHLLPPVYQEVSDSLTEGSWHSSEGRTSEHWAEAYKLDPCVCSCWRTKCRLMLTASLTDVLAWDPVMSFMWANTSLWWPQTCGKWACRHLIMWYSFFLHYSCFFGWLSEGTSPPVMSWRQTSSQEGDTQCGYDAFLVFCLLKYWLTGSSKILSASEGSVGSGEGTAGGAVCCVMWSERLRALKGVLSNLNLNIFRPSVSWCTVREDWRINKKLLW